jgi:hypothetical protein
MMSSSDLERELLLARMKSIQHESSLIMQVVRLQRMRIEQLERQLQAEKRARLARWNLSEKGVCRNCGGEAQDGQVFCRLECLREYRRAMKVANG